VDRASLETLLAQGLSLAGIGRRYGLHESTVGYWARKYELEAIHRARHVPKGRLTKELLEPLVASGMSIAEIAVALGRSRSTVRHWLREHGLKTRQARRLAVMADGSATLMLDCPRHGSTRFRRRSGGGYRCLKCRAEAVSRRRRVVKRRLVDEAGGACRLCGYDRFIAALEFHHLVPAEKRFSLSHRGVARSMEKARAEASKCILLCANCHAEVEAGYATLPGPHFRSSTIAREPLNPHPG
jgi:transposase/5-methylcytosine-specific restriction endonuclease McrA